ncbi:hypothetical protein BGW36DRAFT_305517 [Talaromyces proteolyticus]|uniref:Uncharacterized protein n=1 Tax=Talaromyces proteolyticus TaxID=1131652 RepID=A0AAD4PWK3_9EURO|nr:uncharacterized protein BGW36DRAFT_305517 [Talaromyces proteolyticus]KAH8691614.1 hypothetical protein BGW36DRAFT_305517 [Talaromyces proteolyticus]
MASQSPDKARVRGLPPPYSETVQFQIRRKPIKNRGNNPHGGTVDDPVTTTKAQDEALEQQILEVQALEKDRPRPVNVSLQTASLPRAHADYGLVASPDALSSSSTSTKLNSASPTPEETSPVQSSNWKKTTADHAQKALEEAKHFVGGLVAHPSVSTKHYSILRHSHGIVFYQGSNTFLAISIFADEPLPLDRTIWMQCKGWTGKTGMRAKALFGLNDSWLNVTPGMAIQSDQVTASDERAWQRDIKRFKKKATSSSQSRHILRETAIIRIPVEATDAYYQFVLCQGDNKRKPLCTSPVFRVVSTSSDPSSLRGASLSTLPLELGAWAGSLYLRNTAAKVVTPVTSQIQTATQGIMPSSKTQAAAQTAYSVSGFEDRVNSNIEDANTSYIQTEGLAYTRLGGVEIDIESGPVSPYPINFVARIDVSGGPPNVDTTGLHRIPLVGVPSHILQRLHGHYFGWAKLSSAGQNGYAIGDMNSDAFTWQRCIIFASSIVLQEKVANVRSQKSLRVNASVRFIDEIDIPPTAELRIRIMGFIRPADSISSHDTHQTGLEELLVLEACDIELTHSTLDHPAWGPETPSSIASQRSGDLLDTSSRSFLDKTKDGYANARLAGQRAVGQIPFHRIGIRVQTDIFRDRNITVNGFFIPR